MITSELFERVLIAPAKAGGDTLYVVSGYATSAMVNRHLSGLHDIEKRVALKVIIGMAPKDGIGESNHSGFVHLMNKHSAFNCSYLQTVKPVHSKMYAWFRGNSPEVGYVGSANYTQQAFLRGQGEAMEKTPPGEILEYFSELEKCSCFCTHSDADGVVRRDAHTTSAEIEESRGTQQKEILSLLDRNGNLPERSGLNWGQRPEERRNPNQAYIRIPSKINEAGFFPEIGIHFTIHTDDGQIIIAARRQAEGKAIHSTESNSILGEYFRYRIGVPLGSFITKADLEKYGQTAVTFYKIDDENYYMDFSPAQ